MVRETARGPLQRRTRAASPAAALRRGFPPLPVRPPSSVVPKAAQKAWAGKKKTKRHKGGGGGSIKGPHPLSLLFLLLLLPYSHDHRRRRRRSSSASAATTHHHHGPVVRTIDHAPARAHDALAQIRQIRKRLFAQIYVRQVRAAPARVRGAVGVHARAGVHHFHRHRARPRLKPGAAAASARGEQGGAVSYPSSPCLLAAPARVPARQLLAVAVHHRARDALHLVAAAARRPAVALAVGRGVGVAKGSVVRRDGGVEAVVVGCSCCGCGWDVG
jgi:hypothetical protein